MGLVLTDTGSRFSLMIQVSTSLSIRGTEPSSSAFLGVCVCMCVCGGGGAWGACLCGKISIHTSVVVSLNLQSLTTHDKYLCLALIGQQQMKGI